MIIGEMVLFSRLGLGFRVSGLSDRFVICKGGGEWYYDRWGRGGDGPIG